MTKKTQIGFKAALEENEKPEAEETPQISKVDIDDIVEERVARENDYNEHMRHYESLCEKDYKEKKTRNIILIVLLTLLGVSIIYNFYQYAYKKGAEDQCKGNGPYIQIVDKNNNLYFVEKQ